MLPETFEEKHEFALAIERRKVRLKRKQIEREVLQAPERSLMRQSSAHRHSSGSGSPMVRCQSSAGFAEGSLPVRFGRAARDPLLSLSSTQIVLPHHANHHGNTFGGQIMAWMVDLATVLASRQALASRARGFGRVKVRIEAIDALQFISPSKVGDRISISAQVAPTPRRANITIDCV